MDLLQQHQEWLEWLAKSGYGIDWSITDGSYPPCTLYQLAVAYEREYRDKPLGQGMSVMDWRDCIEDETGPWDPARRG